MGSSSVKAQRLANASNEAIAREANATNIALAEASNDLNYKMFNEQNQWNLDRRNEEWEYNDPSSQVSRLMKAGINPLWAMSAGDSGHAQQLTSAVAKDAASAHVDPWTVQPESSPATVGNIVAATQNLSNSLQGFVKLGLEAEDVATRRGAMVSQSALNRAEAMYKSTQTEGQQIFNSLNKDTYETQVMQRLRELDRLGVEIDNARKSGRNIDALTDNYVATKDQIIAQTDYIYQQRLSLIDQVRQGWKRLEIEKQNADTSQYTAAFTSYYEGENLKQRERQFQFNVQKDIAEFDRQSTQDLLEFLERQRGTWERVAGITVGEYGNLNDKLFIQLHSIGSVLHERLSKDPSGYNIRSFDEWQRIVDSLPLPRSSDSGNLQNPSVLNPSSPWIQ